MKTKLLTFFTTLLPIPAAACLYLGILPAASMAVLIVLTIYLFVRLLRELDPSDSQIKSKPTRVVRTVSESGDHIWPPQPVDDVDPSRKDSRRFSTPWGKLRMRSWNTA